MPPTIDDGKKARGIIAVLATIALVGLCGVFAFHEPPAASKDILLLVVGALIAYNSDIKQFYFGSSSGAKQMMAHQQEVASALATKVAPVVGAAPIVGEGTLPKGTPDDPVAVVIAEEDPGLTSFKALAKQLNPDVTDEQMATSWAAMKAARTPVDVKLP